MVQSPGARARGAAAVERLRRGRRPPRGAQRCDAVHPGQTPEPMLILIFKIRTGKYSHCVFTSVFFTSPDSRRSMFAVHTTLSYEGILHQLLISEDPFFPIVCLVQNVSANYVPK